MGPSISGLPGLKSWGITSKYQFNGVSLSPRLPLPHTAESRRRRQRREARRSILDATEALMIEAGGEFSIRSLAARCGYTAPTIYHYFGDKEGLVDALLEERFARLLARVRRVEVGQDDCENLRRMLRAFLRFGRQNPAFYRLILAGGGKGRDRTPPSSEAAQAILGAPLEALARSGRLQVADQEVAGQAIWALLYGLTALQVTRPDFAWAEDLVEVAVDSMLRGLVLDEAPARGALAAAPAPRREGAGG
jgi:AcrR family transcriptional regulator